MFCVTGFRKEKDGNFESEVCLPWLIDLGHYNPLLIDLMLCNISAKCVLENGSLSAGSNLAYISRIKRLSASVLLWNNNKTCAFFYSVNRVYCLNM